MEEQYNISLKTIDGLNATIASLSEAHRKGRIGQIAWFLTILYLYGSNCVVNFRLLYLAVSKVFCTFVSQFEA